MRENESNDSDALTELLFTLEKSWLLARSTDMPFAQYIISMAIIEVGTKMLECPEEQERFANAVLNSAEASTPC